MNITNDKEYDEAMSKLNTLLKGRSFAQLSRSQQLELDELTQSIVAWEDVHESDILPPSFENIEKEI